MEAATLFFWSPAFKIHPTLCARWSRQMTVFAPPDDEADTRFPATPLHPATLVLAEAAKGTIVTLARLIADRQKCCPVLADLRVTAEEARIEYDPFLAEDSELRHSRMGVVLNRTALSFGGGL